VNPVTTYKTLKNPTEPVLYKDKGSKFIGYAFPIESKDNFKAHIDKLKQEHTSAGHFCFAYQLGIDTPYHRSSDDGEPSNSAGLPIYGQLLAFGVTNVLVVVVRYFGGTKLGVGGLISAYKTTARLSLEASHIQTLDILVPLKLTFAYKELSQVMRIIKKYQLVLKTQSLELDCEIVILAKKISLNSIMTTFEAFHKIKVETLND
jgi:uncharacterized YigZ family protein